MLHTKFRGNQSTSPGEEDFKDRIFMPGGGSGFQLKVEQVTSTLK